MFWENQEQIPEITFLNVTLITSINTKITFWAFPWLLGVCQIEVCRKCSTCKMVNNAKTPRCWWQTRISCRWAPSGKIGCWKWDQKRLCHRSFVQAAPTSSVHALAWVHLASTSSFTHDRIGHNDAFPVAHGTILLKLNPLAGSSNHFSLMGFTSAGICPSNRANRMYGYVQGHPLWGSHTHGSWEVSQPIVCRLEAQWVHTQRPEIYVIRTISSLRGSSAGVWGTQQHQHNSWLHCSVLSWALCD